MNRRLLLTTALAALVGRSALAAEKFDFRRLPEPAALPQIKYLDESGNETDLAALRGRVVVLNLWATWCAPCVVEMPLLDELAGELGDSVRVLTVSEDIKGAEAVTPFFEQRGFDNLPRWMDPKNDLASAYGGGAALPLTVLYDAEGNEVWRVMGGYDWGSAEARELIAEATAG